MKFFQGVKTILMSALPIPSVDVVAQSKAMKEARAQKAAALRMKIQERQMRDILDSWGLQLMFRNMYVKVLKPKRRQRELSHLRDRQAVHGAVAAAERRAQEQAHAAWLSLLPRLPSNDILVACRSPLPPIAAAMTTAAPHGQPGAFTRPFAQANQPGAHGMCRSATCHA